MGRRHRDQQQQRRAEARIAARPARSRATDSRSERQSIVPRYVVDMLGILAIALLVNQALIAAGVINGLLRIIVALVVGRVAVTLVRRTLEARL